MTNKFKLRPVTVSSERLRNVFHIYDMDDSCHNPKGEILVAYAAARV